MKLHQLLQPLNITPQNLPDLEVSGIQFQSNKVKNGNIFVAIKGLQDDGHKYINEAIEKGAIAIIGERPIILNSVPYFQVSDTREALAKLASTFYHHPSKTHKMIGITGTNGKTTTSYIIKHLLNAFDRSCALISTVENFINGKSYPSTATTPNALELQHLLKKSDDEYVVLEVSSHGLHQKRVEGIAFDYAVFTNLTHEHLDYHNSLDDYFQVKSGLFQKLKSDGKAIIFSNCPWGRRLIKKLRCENIPVYTYGSSLDDDLQYISRVGNTIKVSWLNMLWEFELSLPGKYNVYNCLAAILVALLEGVSISMIKQSLKHFRGVPGRFQIYRHPSNIHFIIDYAHTPDGLEKFLKAVKQLSYKRIIHIFGFRGNRDITKRGLMLNISNQYSQQTILTIDDLNGVQKETMIHQLEELLKNYGCEHTVIISDRTLAIKYAWDLAKAGDVIVITGKGPELYQEKFQLPARSDTETIHYLFRKLPSTS